MCKHSLQRQQLHPQQLLTSSRSRLSFSRAAFSFRNRSISASSSANLSLKTLDCTPSPIAELDASWNRCCCWNDVICWTCSYRFKLKHRCVGNITSCTTIKLLLLNIVTTHIQTENIFLNAFVLICTKPRERQKKTSTNLYLCFGGFRFQVGKQTRHQFWCRWCWWTINTFWKKDPILKLALSDKAKLNNMCIKSP